MTLAGFEPAIFGMKTQCPKPLDDRVKLTLSLSKGEPGAIRTLDQQLKRLMLYQAELRAQV